MAWLVACLIGLLINPLEVRAQTRSPVVVNCPKDIVVECSGPGGTVVHFRVTASSSAGAITAIQSVPPSGTAFPSGVTTVRCTALDSARNSGSCSFTVTVRDTTPPLIHTPGPVVVHCASAAGAVAEYLVRTDDSCSAPSLTVTPPSGSLFPVGSNNVTCVAIDTSGNARTNFFPVIVTTECADCVELTCPTAPIQTEADETGQRVVFFPVLATNLCGGSAWARSVPPSGSPFPMGKTVVKCSAGVGLAMLKERSFEVIVRDATPPVIKVPGRFEYPCSGLSLDGQVSAEVWYPEIKVHDNVDLNPDLTLTPPTGSFLPLGEHTITAVASDYSGNRSTNTFVVQVVLGPKCLVDDVASLEQLPANWDFELGLVGWSQVGTPFVDVGTAFKNQPTFGENFVARRIHDARMFMENKIGGDYWRDVTYPIGIQGRFFVGTAENRTGFTEPRGGVQGDGPMGALRSRKFTVKHQYISFLIGGSTGPDVAVEFLVETTQDDPKAEKIGTGWFKLVRTQSPSGSEQLQRRWFDVSQFLGADGVLRIVDGSTVGHINVDDFRFIDLSPLEQTVQVGTNSWPAVTQQAGGYYDWNAPVWGFADLHTHPMSHLGFRGKIMHGEPDGDITIALGDCRCTHGGYGPDNQCGDYVRQFLFAVMDDAGPDSHGDGWNNDKWKRFRSFPVFSTKVHQQMWHEWITRAYYGGLRTMVALCVNSQLLGHVAKGDLPERDKEVGDIQIDALKDFVARHSDIMEIALDPVQLRSIVRANKLAIIIGSELDDIGNFAFDPTVSADSPTDAAKKKVSDELDRLYAKGLRYIFPEHLINNKFGGTAIAGDMLNMANKYVNDEPFEAEAADVFQRIDTRLGDMDFTAELNEIMQDFAIAAPAAPILLPALAPVADVLMSEKLGPVPPGTSLGIATGLGAFGVMAALGAPVLEMAGLDSIPQKVWPINGNFPKPPLAFYGHRNKRGLTELGKHAVREMMKRGMMIDMDHMSRHMAESVLEMAEGVSGGYPLNSGHNSFSDLQAVGERGENGRTRDQVARIRELGGLMGVGWENHKGVGFEETYYNQPLLAPEFSTSIVDNNCAGSSRTWAQDYLLALEMLRGGQVGFGTDINGVIVGPSPRFGPQAAFPNEGWGGRHHQIQAQNNGVLYEPRYGRPITSSVFLGRAVDPDVSPWVPARYDFGYSYTGDQRDFMVALNIFYWKPGITDAELQTVTQALHDGHPNKEGIGLYVQALRRSYEGKPRDGLSEFPAMGWAVREFRTGHPGIPGQAWLQDPFLQDRFWWLVRVWDEYQRIFGKNIPLKRAETQFKQWDINFEGVAHYGMIPDFLQDLANVGLSAEDMSPVFQSSEDFARMWTRCLRGAWNVVHPPLSILPIQRQETRAWSIRWFGEPGDRVEEADHLGDDASWRPFDGEIVPSSHGQYEAIPNHDHTEARFYRVVKQ
ncbi:MAG: HYR domain-containing protein [Verrucomicrobiota bacterium]